MDYKEYSAKTLDEAITMASVDLGVTSTELHYDVVENGSSGILGFGRKDWVIKAIRKSDLNEVVHTRVQEEKAVEETKPVKVENHHEPEQKYEKRDHEDRHDRHDRYERIANVEPISPDDVEKIKKDAKEFLDEVFKAMNLDVNMQMDFSGKDNSLSIDFDGDHMGIIIGKRGQTLDSLQYLVNLVVNKNTDSYVRIKLDTEDYRKRRKDTLENLAKNIAYKVRKSGKPVTLEAMNPYERRTIHYALQKDRYVTTYSEGEEPFRHVVVTVKK